MPKTFGPNGTITLFYTTVRPFLNRLQHLLSRFGYSATDRHDIRLACEEALTNAHLHGNSKDARKSISVQYRVDQREFFIRVEDRGKGFDPHTVPDPTALENLEKPSGRGLLLMRTHMDDVRFSKKGNVVKMRRSRRMKIP